MKRFLACLAMLLPLLLVACGGGGGSATPTPAQETPQELLADSAQAASQLSSFHFKLSHENGSTPLPLGLALSSAEGDVAVPDKISTDVKAKASGINVSVKVIGIDDETWVTNPFTRDWDKLGDTNLRDFADPAALVTSLLPEVKDAQYAGRTEIDGAETQQVTGTLDSGALEPALGFAEPGFPVRVDAWIGVEDHLPRRVRLTGKLSSDEKDNVSRQIELSRFNENVNIEAPE